jgi:hypothetical protein
VAFILEKGEKGKGRILLLFIERSEGAWLSMI